MNIATISVTDADLEDIISPPTGGLITGASVPGRCPKLLYFTLPGLRGKRSGSSEESIWRALSKTG